MPPKNEPRFKPRGITPTPEQVRIQTHHARRVIVMANAGSAKTTTLALRIAESLERGVLPRSGLTMFAAILPPLGVPFYLWRTRPTFGAACKAMAWALGFYLLASVVIGGAEALGLGLRPLR